MSKIITYDPYGKGSDGSELIPNQIYMAKFRGVGDYPPDKDFRTYRAVRNGRLFSMWQTDVHHYNLPHHCDFLITDKTDITMDDKENKWTKQYRESNVHFHRMVNVTKIFTCPICTHDIQLEDYMIRVFSKFFPATFIHSKCDHENSIELIETSWKQAQKFRCWFEQ